MIKETPHEVILRAKAKGILDRIGSNHQITGKEPHVQTMRVKKKTHSYSSQHSSSLSIQSKNDETRGRNNATSLGQQETSKRQQLTQGGHYYFLGYFQLTRPWNQQLQNADTVFNPGRYTGRQSQQETVSRMLVQPFPNSRMPWPT